MKPKTNAFTPKGCNLFVINLIKTSAIAVNHTENVIKML